VKKKTVLKMRLCRDKDGAANDYYLQRGDGRDWVWLTALTVHSCGELFLKPGDKMRVKVTIEAAK